MYMPKKERQIKPSISLIILRGNLNQEYLLAIVKKVLCTLKVNTSERKLWNENFSGRFPVEIEMFL